MITPPVAKKQPKVLELHGHKRTDNYYWLRDDSRENPEIIAHLNEENKYTSERMQHTAKFQEALFDEIIQRMQKDHESVPHRIGNKWYYSRYVPGGEHEVFCCTEKAQNGSEEILLDANKLAENTDYFALGDKVVSEDGSMLAFSTDISGRRIFQIQIQDLASGELLPEKLEGASREVVWANDNKTLFYIKKDLQTLLGYQVFRHVIGTEQDQDQLVYEEKDYSFLTRIAKSRDGSSLVIYHESTLVKGASILSADNPEGEPTIFLPLEKEHEYRIDLVGDWYLILTNWEAKNFRVMKVHRDHHQDKSQWQEVVPYNENRFIEDFVAFEKHVVVVEKEDGQTRLRIITLADLSSKSVSFNDTIYTAWLMDNFCAANDSVRVRYSSIVTPETVYDIDLETGNLALMKQDKVLGGFDSSQYKSERINVKSRDGKYIPVSLAYRKDTFKKDGTNPVCQFVYGAYGITVDPFFRADRLSLLDRGFVYAIAHVRGGSMLGKPWYEDGKMMNKKNSFYDFIDVTKHLVAENYAHKDKVFAEGGSAGGLLIGAVVNMAPELFLGATAHVPFVDLMTTISDPSLPLTTNEYDEWGDPKNKEHYEYMLSYSPYDNVTRQDYPNLLVTSGLHDSQVQYFEPAKWVAKLREHKTDDNMLLFDIDMDAGHGGGAGRYNRLKILALEYAFMFDLLGITE